jgi:hypothetical protein
MPMKIYIQSITILSCSTPLFVGIIRLFKTDLIQRLKCGKKVDRNDINENLLDKTKIGNFNEFEQDLLRTIIIKYYIGISFVLGKAKYFETEEDNENNDNINKEEEDIIISKELKLNRIQKIKIVTEILQLIRKINSFLLLNIGIKHIFYELFEKAWNEYQQDYSFNIKNLIIKYILTPNYICIPSTMKNVEDYPFKNNSNTNMFETLLVGYLALSDLLNNKISKKFPLENGNLEYHLGDKIVIENINIKDPNYKLIKILLQTKKKNEFEESYLFMNKNSIIFGNEKIDEKTGKKLLIIKNIQPIREMEICIDNTFANSMQLYFKNKNYMIECDSNENRIEIKSELEKKRNEFRQWEQDNLSKLLEDKE